MQLQSVTQRLSETAETNLTEREGVQEKRIEGRNYRRILLEERYPCGLQKLEARGFRIFRVEEIYTEKMITLSNVSPKVDSFVGFREVQTLR